MNKKLPLELIVLASIAFITIMLFATVYKTTRAGMGVQRSQAFGTR